MFLWAKKYTNCKCVAMYLHKSANHGLFWGDFVFHQFISFRQLNNHQKQQHLNEVHNPQVKATHAIFNLLSHLVSHHQIIFNIHRPQP